MTYTNAPTLSRTESWLATKRRDAGYLCTVIAGLMLWSAGFLDLITHTSAPATILGRYSIPFAAFLCVYALGFVVWLALLIRPDGIAQLKRAIGFVQNRTWLGLGILFTFAALIASMFLIQRWATFPLLELSVLLLGLLVCGTILLARLRPESKIHGWRKAILGVAAALIGLEVLLQIAAILGVLPFENMTGLFTPYGRVYQNKEGHGHGVTNRFGWYYPEDGLKARSKVILMTGDTFVLGLQVKPYKNMGVALQRTLKTTHGAQVVSLGFPGYGPGLYADAKLAPYTMLRFNPSEVVVFFHLADDIQTITAPNGELPFFTLDEKGDLALSSEDAGLRHKLQHLIIRAYDPLNPVETLQTHLFTVQLLRRAVGHRYVYRDFGDRGAPPMYPSNTDFATDDQPFGKATFVFEKNPSPRAEQALTLAFAQLRSLKEELDALGIRMRLVTIPYFPQAFYASGVEAWNGELGEYDLLRPERELAAFARQHEIPALPMGEYMMSRGLSREQVRALFLRKGVGHFSPAGHQFFAQAVAECFYNVGGGDACPSELGVTSFK